MKKMIGVTKFTRVKKIEVVKNIPGTIGIFSFVKNEKLLKVCLS